MSENFSSTYALRIHDCFDTITIVKTLTLFILFLTLLLTVVSPVYAAQPWGESCLYDGDVATIQCLVPLFSNVVRAVLQLAGVVLFITFVVAGFNFLLSGGDPKRLQQARSTLTYAIMGLVVIVVAYLIIQLISTITGVQGLDRFTIPRYE